MVVFYVIFSHLEGNVVTYISTLIDEHFAGLKAEPWYGILSGFANISKTFFTEKKRVGIFASFPSLFRGRI